MKGLTGKRWWSALLLAAAVIVVFKLVNNIEAVWGWLGKLMNVLTPFIIGAMISLLLYRPCGAIERRLRRSRFRVLRGPARAWSIVAVYLILLVMLAVVVAVIVPIAAQGLSGLIDAMPGYVNQVKEFIDGLSEKGGIFASLDIDSIVEEITAFLKRFLTPENIAGYLSGLFSVASGVVRVLIAFIVSIYMLAGLESLLGSLRRLGNAFLPEKAVRLLTNYIPKSTNIYARYVYSMLIDALCIGVLLIPGLYISGIPYPLSFAVCIGVANLIPYFGAITSGALAVLVLLLSSGSWGRAAFLAVYILVAQQVDANVLQPRIYSRSVGIKPLYVLLAITVGGGLGGFVGMLVAVPSMAVLQMLLNDFVLHRDRVKREKREHKEQRTREQAEQTGQPDPGPASEQSPLK